MTPEPRTGFAEVCAALCPGFRAVEPVRARKSELLAGEIDGAPVIAKRLAKSDAVWAWYFARELAAYRAFAVLPPPVRVPQLVAASDDVLVIERFTSASIGARRRPYAELPAETVRALVAAHARFATWTGTFSTAAPEPRVQAQLRRRLLEDPTAPVHWITDGIERSRTRGIVGERTADTALAALAEHAPVAASHGDLLLRNAFVVDGDVALVDWECAGPHVADWDLALLWTQLSPAGRRLVEESATGHERHRALLALIAFALAREVVFLEAFRADPEHRGMQRVRADLRDVSDRLAAC